MYDSMSYGGVKGGVAWDVLLNQVVGLQDNDCLDHKTKDSLVNAS